MTDAGDIFSVVPSAPPVPAATPETVTIDLPCRRCQYNLRGLSTAARCPECGTPVGRSIAGDLLQFCEPSWVEKLNLGVTTAIGSTILGVLAIVLSMAVNRRLGSRPLLGILLSFSAALLYWIGAWLLTTADPSGLGEDRYGTARRIIRITLLVAVITHVCQILMRGGDFPPIIALPLRVAVAVGGGVSVVGTVAMLNYLSKLSARIPDERIERRARFLMWAMGISDGLLAIVVAPLTVQPRLLISRSRTPTSLMVMGLAFGCPAALAIVGRLIFGIMYLLMLVQLGQRLKESAAAARQAWAAEGVA